MNFKYFTFILIFNLLSIATWSQIKKTNIVLILADDLGIGDIGSYGQQKIHTPNLDRLTQQGLKFENFYTGTSVCAPSRASLMTGLHTGHTAIRGNKEIQPEGQYPLPANSITIANQLKANGYVTGAFGKWGLGMVGSIGDPNNQGFDEFFGFNCQRQAHSYYPNHLWHNQTQITYPTNLLSRTHYAADIIHNETLRFIEQHKHEPFFLYVPTVLPHAELSGPRDSLFRLYENQFEETPFKHGHYADIDKPRAMYASMVTRLDHHVGEIVRKLEELGIAENTLILFCSDNGPHQEGGADPAFFQSSGIYKGIKRSLYEGGIRTSFIAYWPNTITPNRSTLHRAAFWDIMPTLLDIATAKTFKQTDGISFKPTLINEGKQKKPEVLYWEFHEEGGRQAVLHKDWKLIVQQVKDPNKRFVELYNIKEDPSEKINIATKYPNLVRKLSKLIEKNRIEHPDFPLIF